MVLTSFAAVGSDLAGGGGSYTHLIKGSVMPTVVRGDASSPCLVTDTLEMRPDVLAQGNAQIKMYAPVAIAFDKFSGLAYLSNYGDVIPINTVAGSNTILSPPVYTGMSQPYGGLMFDTSNKVWYLENATNTISAIKAGGPTKITVGSCPDGMAFDPVSGFVYVANYNSCNVTVINGTTDKVDTSIAVPDPIGVVYDPGTNDFYVSNYTPGDATGSLTAINGSTNKVVSVMNVGMNPAGLVYDPSNGYLFLIDSYYRNVSVIDPSNGKFIANITLVSVPKTTGLMAGPAPGGIAYDPVDGDVYFVDMYCSSNSYSNVFVINATTHNVVRTWTVGRGAFRVAFNPIDNEVYVTNVNSGNISVINTTTDSISSLYIDAGPAGMQYVPSSGTLYVANPVRNEVSVINTSTDLICSNITVGNAPFSLVTDSQNGYIYITNKYSNNVSILNPQTKKVTGSIDVGSEPDGIAYDSNNGFLYVANSGSNNVSVINPATNKVAASIHVGQRPEGIAYGDHFVYVANSASGNISIINDTENKVNATFSGSAGYGFAFDSNNGYMYVPLSTGSILIFSGDKKVDILRSVSQSVSYVGCAVFDRLNGYIYVSGYYDGKVTVINGATNEILSNISAGCFPLGSAFDPANSVLFVGNGESGTISIIPLQHPSPQKQYGASFVESGLTSGTSWSVTFNGTSESSTTDSIDFTAVNGTYSYTISNVSGYNLTTSSGSISISGKNVTQNVTFTPVKLPSAKYAVTFTESGLSPGTIWYVNLSDGLSSGPITGSTYTFYLANGTYTYEISVVSGYSVSTTSGSLGVSGSNISRTVTFSPVKNSTSGIPMLEIYVAAIVVVSAALVASLVFMKRKKKS